MMNVAVKKAAKAVLVAPGVFARDTGPGVQILIYHQVGGGRTVEMDVGREAFSQQATWFARHASVVPLPEAVAGLGTAEPRTARQTVLTFDDGYRDNIQNAFPILVEHQLPFTIYACTSYLEGGAAPTRLGDGESAPPLEWDDLGTMLESGLLTVGAHSHAHKAATEMSAAQFEDDAARCDDLIKARLGVRPEHFAYPKAIWHAAADAVVRRRYRSAVVAGGRANRPGADPHRLARLAIQRSDGSALFRAKMRGFLALEDRLAARLGGTRG